MVFKNGRGKSKGEKKKKEEKSNLFLFNILFFGFRKKY